jgi:hypothetical protein
MDMVMRPFVVCCQSVQMLFTPGRVLNNLPGMSQGMLEYSKVGGNVVIEPEVLATFIRSRRNAIA